MNEAVLAPLALHHEHNDGTRKERTTDAIFISKSEYIAAIPELTVALRRQV